MNTNAQYSILGTPVQLHHTDDDTLVVHAPLRIGPGRKVPIRSGATTFQATVLSAHICSLDAENGPTYELRLESVSRTASPADDTNVSKKGGWWQRGLVASALGTA